EGDTGLTRYTPQPAEVSLVDNPCIPTATFEIVKEDGSTELRKFRGAQDVAKIRARHSKDDLERLQTLHDTAVELGATCPPADDTGDDNVDDEDDAAEKFVGRDPGLERILNKIIEALEVIHITTQTLNVRIAELESQPLSGGPALRGARTISKSEDAGGAIADSDPLKAFGRHLDTLPPGERALALMKFTLANPLPAAPGR
ncbi:MAG TPA: hypothetical protein VGI20_10945, partial [Rhizomicrobium sp.]